MCDFMARVSAIGNEKSSSTRRRSLPREKVLNKRAELHEFRKLGGFAEIPVGAECVHVLAVALRIRGCHDQDKRVLAARTGAQPAQYLVAFIAGHVDVKEDEVRTGRRRIGVRLLEKPDRLLAVVRDVNLRVDPRFRESLPNQVDIRLAVLGDQNLPGAVARLIRPGE